MTRFQDFLMFLQESHFFIQAANSVSIYHALLFFHRRQINHCLSFFSTPLDGTLLTKNIFK